MRVFWYYEIVQRYVSIMTQHLGPLPESVDEAAVCRRSPAVAPEHAKGVSWGMIAGNKEPESTQENEKAGR